VKGRGQVLTWLLFNLSSSMWASIRTMQFFLEHVLLKHDFQNSVAYLIRLQLVSLCNEVNWT
jgi:hypothetical protein